MDHRSLEELTVPHQRGEAVIQDETEIQQLNDELEKLENEENWLTTMIDNVKGQLD